MQIGGRVTGISPSPRGVSWAVHAGRASSRREGESRAFGLGRCLGGTGEEHGRRVAALANMFGRTQRAGGRCRRIFIPMSFLQRRLAVDKVGYRLLHGSILPTRQDGLRRRCRGGKQKGAWRPYNIYGLASKRWLINLDNQFRSSMRTAA